MSSSARAFSQLRRATSAGACIFSLAFFAAGCAGHSAKTLEARQALDAGRPKEAMRLYNEELDVESGKDLPEDVGGDNALLILDRSLIQQELGDFPSSSRDLETADKQVEMLDFSRSTVDDIGKYVFSDDTGPYKAPPYEKLLVNTMNMVNYLARHDLNGARIEARRLAVMQKYVRDSQSPGLAMIAPGSYLAGFVFERSGRADEALRYYDEALEFGQFPSLVAPIRRLQRQSSYDSERIRKLLAAYPEAAASSDAAPTVAAAPAAPGAPDANAPGELLVVLNYGRVPAKVARRIPIGLALTYASLYMSSSQSATAGHLAGQGLVTWVNFPDLEEQTRTLSTPSVRVNGGYVQLEGALAVDVEARKAYDRDKGAIIASAITRLITRVAVGEGARAAAGDQGLLGILLSLGTQAALTAADTPDTRSWATLPARITVGRILLPPGTHDVTLEAQGTRKTVRVQMKPGGWEAVTLTVLR